MKSNAVRGPLQTKIPHRRPTEPSRSDLRSTDYAIPQEGFHEAWLLQIAVPESDVHLWIRFGLLTSRNGFRKRASVSAIVFDANELMKVTRIRRGYSLREAMITETPELLAVQIENSVLHSSGSKGKIEKNSQAIQWNLSWDGAGAEKIRLTPPLFALPGLGQTQFEIPFPQLAVSGSIQFNGRTIKVSNARASVQHTTGTKQVKEWWWAQALQFETAGGAPIDLEFVGVTGQPTLPLPAQSSFWVRWNGKSFLINSLKDVFLTTSEASDYAWKFSFRKGPYDFHGRLEVPPKSVLRDDFEDTDGSPLQSLKSGYGRLELKIFKNGQLEVAALCPKMVSWERVNRNASLDN